MYVLGGFLSNVGSAIMDGIRTLMLTLCDGVYKLIYITYFIFEKLGTAEILKDDQIAGIFRRIGLIIGIFMLFRLTFAFIQYIIDPDAMADKKKGMGNIIKKILISIVLLGSTSTLFNLAFKVQNLIIDNHIISKVIFNSEAGASDNFGAELSAEVFTSFFRLNPDAVNANTLCATLLTNDSNGKNTMYTSMVNNNGEITEAYKCVTEKDSNDEYIATFDGGGFIALVVGIIISYTLLIYTIQVGVRVIQLAYLQIIAPVPIMMYITPQGEDKLKKWGQQCLTTFLDFFLRTMIIYFAVFVIQNIWENNTIGTILTAGHSNSATWQTAYIGVIMIIAVLVFAKKVPNLIKEIFPALGGSAGFDYGLNFKKQVVEPLKAGYNSPLGWGLKLGKAGAVAAIGAIDRKKYGLPKPRTKLQEKMDKLTPGRAEAIKNKRAGAVASMEREQLYKEGEEIYNRMPDGEIKDENGILRAGVFKSKEFINSWQKVSDAKKLTKKYDAELAQAQARLSRGEITIESEEYKSAVGNSKAANGRLEAAKKDHENMRKIYTKDARTEDAYNYYHDLQFGTANSSEATSNTNASNNTLRRVEEVTGVTRPSASENGAPTSDNSLLGELADQVEQERLRNDVLNNLRNDNNNNNNGNR